MTSCSLLNKPDDDQESLEHDRVDVKYSLTKDRADLDKLRENMPTDVKRINDEKALILDWTQDFRYSPEIVRDKFNTLLRKKRDLFNKDMTRLRDNYSKIEKKKRDEFLKQLADERKDFLRERVDSERRAQFFNDQDEVRRVFFQEQREKRDEYESESREKRKDFEDYLKEKQDEFSAMMKEYSVSWRENEKRKKEEQERFTESNGQ